MTTTVDFAEALKLMTDSHKTVATAISLVSDDWSPEIPPTTIVFSKVGRALSTNVEELLPSELQQIFSVVEVLMVNGDETVRNAVATGFLESLLGCASRGELQFEKFSSHLGPETRRYCKEWDAFTGVVTLGLE